MTQGREAVVRFINKNDRPSVIHLHGSFSRAAFDGWAEDTLPPNTHKDYCEPPQTLPTVALLTVWRRLPVSV